MIFNNIMSVYIVYNNQNTVTATNGIVLFYFYTYFRYRRTSAVETNNNSGNCFRCIYVGS